MDTARAMKASDPSTDQTTVQPLERPVTTGEASGIVILGADPDPSVSDITVTSSVSNQ